MTTVGFVGTGRMGAPMVARLVQAGHDVRALGRSPDKRAAIGESGARAVAGLDEVADGADVVVVCVFTDDQVREVCLDGGLLDAMAPGSVLVVHTTGSPRTVEALAARAPAVAVLDAPVSGGPHDIAAGQITLFVGGDATAVERARPVLASYGDPILHVGELGAGQWVKLINNTLFAAQLGLLREAASFGARVGVDETGLLSAIGHGSGASRAAEIVGTRGSVQSFIESVGEFLGKDVAVVREVAAETGSDLGLLEGLLDVVVGAPSG
ncbi:NAD(P)-dependent oxidoreductase [Mycolicibacterium austroafricanum]|uniref:NAD(P)-dependent oxidoreductase n=1 Tax=Mycolicibacterium austroafricanum TaxID=39687 RepID=UPI001CA31839|nr:NAD(P)-dependent oxidoreductase [Mycolicibacterium austroafricanum]QZT61364.1 NAD(P)-dependent oxidoreductase [Mycolicibacterium austroafricanum]